MNFNLDLILIKIKNGKRKKGISWRYNLSKNRKQ
jgi:hypothetical protein